MIFFKKRKGTPGFIFGKARAVFAARAVGCCTELGDEATLQRELG